MIHTEAPGLLAGAVVLGLIHGIEPGHGWPVAAAYAMDRSNTWGAGFAASFILGVGHLISSIAMVAAYFYAIAYFDLTSLDEPIVVAGASIGGPLGIVAGLLLIGLGIREYYGGGHGHGHGTERDDAEGHAHGDDHSHDEGHNHSDGEDHERSYDDGHRHPHDEESESGVRSKLRTALPFGGGGHEHMDTDTAQDKGLLGIAWVAFVLGFAHEEEFEIIALCTGSTHCLELMLAYAATVVFGIVGLTMLLLAGYQRFEERVERITPYLPAFSAAVLIVMGLGFVLGVL